MIKEYNSLKGILALMIFAHHCPIEFGCKLGLGVIAVTLFFMLSGFLSTVGYRDKILSPNFSYRAYLIGKGIKFYPMHWLCLLMIAPLIFYGSSHWYYQLPVMAINATLLQSLVPYSPVFFSFNAVAWFLSDTLIFVALFPLIMKWMLTTGMRTKIYVGMILLTTYAIAWALIPTEYTHRFFYISPIFRIVDFIVGMQCGLWFMQLKEETALTTIAEKYSTPLHFVGILLLIALVWLSTVDEEVCFHSIIYLPMAGILLVLIGLNGGVFINPHITRIWQNQLRILLVTSNCP